MASSCEFDARVVGYELPIGLSSIGSELGPTIAPWRPPSVRTDIQEDKVPLALNRLILYARDVEGTVAFYEKHFGFRVLRLPGDRIVELVAQSGGANIMVHAAAKGVKTAQVTVKLAFDVEDVSDFCEKSARNGLTFGAEHPANGYSYANAKDPCGNNIQVTSRAFRKADS